MAWTVDDESERFVGGVLVEARELCRRMACNHVYDRTCGRCELFTPLRLSLMALDEHERHSTDD